VVDNCGRRSSRVVRTVINIPKFTEEELAAAVRIGLGHTEDIRLTLYCTHSECLTSSDGVPECSICIFSGSHRKHFKKWEKSLC